MSIVIPPEAGIRYTNKFLLTNPSIEDLLPSINFNFHDLRHFCTYSEGTLSCFTPASTCLVISMT